VHVFFYKLVHPHSNLFAQIQRLALFLELEFHVLYHLLFLEVPPLGTDASQVLEVFESCSDNVLVVFVPLACEGNFDFEL
jgi:hypothetical protein